MTREQLFFIQILSDHLNGKRTEAPDHCDWRVLLDYARKHQVSGIVYAQIKDYVPAEINIIFRKETFATFFFHSRREEYMSTITEKLQENGIPFFIIKGPQVATLYPVPALRAMGDIDMVFHPYDREKAHAILLQNGFVCKTKQIDREWQYYKDNLEIELHDRLVYEENVNEEGQDQFFNDCWKYLKDGILDWTFHLLFLIFHLRKHLMNSGAGFRYFADLAVVVQNVTIDWEWLKNNLEATNMLCFAKKCYSFVKQWFGIETPLAEEIDDEFYETATQKIFADGVFGFNNIENMDSGLVNQFRNKQPHRFRAFQLVVQEVFPSYRTLINEKTYSYLARCPFLLPVAWVHRMIRGSRKKKETVVINNIKRIVNSKEKIEKRNEIMRKWGL